MLWGVYFLFNPKLDVRSAGKYSFHLISFGERRIPKISEHQILSQVVAWNLIALIPFSQTETFQNSR